MSLLNRLSWWLAENPKRLTHLGYSLLILWLVSITNLIFCDPRFNDFWYAGCSLSIAFFFILRKAVLKAPLIVLYNMEHFSEGHIRWALTVLEEPHFFEIISKKYQAVATKIQEGHHYLLHGRQEPDTQEIKSDT